MKKIITLLILFVLPVFALASCGTSRPALEDRAVDGDHLKEESYEGVIKKLDSLDVYQEGTHQLITDDDDTIFIQSPVIDLNRYLDEKVVVKGKMKKMPGDSKDVFTVTAIAYVDERDAVQLKNYENKPFGFRFAYPSIWMMEEESDALTFRFQEKAIMTISVISQNSDVKTYALSQESGKSTEVTVGAQQAFRFTVEDNLRFYVPNPPKKKIYLISYQPTVNAVDDPKAAEAERELFYDLLDSFELIYLSRPEGEKCGGLQQIQCPDQQVCQFDTDGKYAEGICVPVSDVSLSSSCPYIAPPFSCDQYRISEYNAKGCPSRYECLDQVSEPASDSDSDASESESDSESSDAISQNNDEADDSSPEPEAIEEGEADEKSEADYEVPGLSDVSAAYKNERRGFSLLYPKKWYYASFGPSDGALWKVGFSNVPLEEVDQSIITLSILKQPKGNIFKKMDDEYYVVEGPSDLSDVMKKMVDSLDLLAI